MTTMTNRDRLDDECDDETLSFGKKCETSRSKLQLLKAAETKGKYLEFRELPLSKICKNEETI